MSASKRKYVAILNNRQTISIFFVIEKELYNICLNVKYIYPLHFDSNENGETQTAFLQMVFLPY